MDSNLGDSGMFEDLARGNCVCSIPLEIEGVPQHLYTYAFTIQEHTCQDVTTVCVPYSHPGKTPKGPHATVEMYL